MILFPVAFIMSRGNESNTNHKEEYAYGAYRFSKVSASYRIESY